MPLYPPPARIRTFDPRDYGTVDLTGAVPSTAAIDAAIAAMNNAGRGTLYIPPGNMASAGGHVIAVPFNVGGEGSAGMGDAIAAYMSRITCTSPTAPLFTTTGGLGKLEGFSIVNSAATPTAGAGIVVAGSLAGARVHWDDVVVQDFYTGIDIQAASFFDLRNVLVVSPHKYGVRFRNVVNPDWSDSGVENLNVFAWARSAEAGIEIDSGSGLKIHHFKVVGTAGGNGFDYGVKIRPTTSPPALLTILELAGFSIEGSKINGIDGLTTDGSLFINTIISDGQIHNYTNVTGHAIEFNGAGGGYFYTNLVIHGVLCLNNGGLSSAIKLTRVRDAIVGPLLMPPGNFGSVLEKVSCERILDATGGVAGSVQLTPSTYNTMIEHTVGLAAYHELAEATGTVAADSGVLNVPGAFVNAPALGQPGMIAGSTDTAVLFSAASSQYVDIPRAGFPQLMTDFSLEIEVALTTNGVVHLLMDDDGSLHGPRLYVGSDNKIVFSWVTTACLGGTALGTGKHHILATLTPTDAYIYLDGVVDGHFGPTTGLTCPLPQTGNLAIGRRVSANDLFMNAKAQKAAWYTRALTPAEAATHAHNALGS